MFSKINHVAIVSEHYAKSALFYQSVFGMRTSDKTRTSRAQTVGDGYVGLNINPKKAGRAAGLDHFGIEVEDAETAFGRIISTHDPDGNMFDISQKNMTNRTSVYRDQEGKAEVNPRHINHVALRTMRADEMAEFYRDVFELAPTNKGVGDRNHYLTDGHMTLVIMPWDITDYDGTGIVTAGMDHIGFKVESVEKLKEDVDRIAADNPLLAPFPIGTGAEGKAHLELFRRSCPLGQHHMADCDGILIDVAAD
jgi:catechol 2,3-dioxygenase-like lactoylglutathione lyase family enzyme